MTLKDLLNLISWDMRVNHGWGWDFIRAKLLLIEVRIEQYIYRKLFFRSKPFRLIWYVFRALAQLYQWFLFNSRFPGSTAIGRGLRLPHPQNIIISGYADIGEFCTIYQNVTVAWNGFYEEKPNSPKVGDQVLIGTGVTILGDITIGSDVLIGAGAIVVHSVPDHSRVTNMPPKISSRRPTEDAAEPGSERHINDPFSIWR